MEKQIIPTVTLNVNKVNTPNKARKQDLSLWCLEEMHFKYRYRDFRYKWMEKIWLNSKYKENRVAILILEK